MLLIRKTFLGITLQITTTPPRGQLQLICDYGTYSHVAAALTSLQVPNVPHVPSRLNVKHTSVASTVTEEER